MGVVRATRERLRLFSWVDLAVVLSLLGTLYGLLVVAKDWSGPFRPMAPIRSDLFSLVLYSFFSLVRVCLGYIIAIAFSLSVGYVAARSRFLEPFVIPVIDIMQSVPVVGFIPGTILALIHLFPHSNMGLEIAAILLIFTGEVSNLVFSVYTSVKSVPGELREVASLFRFSRWQTFRKVEFPFGLNDLLWNSMLSMSGGWFYLILIESFTLGGRQFRLPGIGSYMAVAYERKDYTAVAAGIGVMFLLILVVDRVVWAPLVAWSDRYRLEGADSQSQSWIFEWLKRSQLLASYLEMWKRFSERFQSAVPMLKATTSRRRFRVLWRAVNWVLLIGSGYAIWGAVLLLGRIGEFFRATSLATWLELSLLLGVTLFRVALAVVLGSLWAIPVGVWIGIHPKLAKRFQPIVQIIASFPAPIVFPLVTTVLIGLGITMDYGAVVLMVISSQWYILFNVLSGATRIPKMFVEVGKVFRLSSFSTWKKVILPAIFPSLVNAWITAAGGAWNATIVSELVRYGDQTFSAVGLGSKITLAAESLDYYTLAAGMSLMVAAVVVLDRLVFGALFRLAETKYRVELS